MKSRVTAPEALPIIGFDEESSEHQIVFRMLSTFLSSSVVSIIAFQLKVASIALPPRDKHFFSISLDAFRIRVARCWGR
jgi:hypothetical protein